VHLNKGIKITGSVQYIPDDEGNVGGEKDENCQETQAATGQPAFARNAITVAPAMWTVADSNHTTPPHSRSTGGTLF